MVWRVGFDPAAHAVEAFVQQDAQAPARAVARQTVEIVDVVVAVAVGVALLFGVDAIQPVVGDDLPGAVVDQPGVGVAGVGVRLDAPVAAVDVLFNGLGGVDVGGVLVETQKVLALHLVHQPVEHEGLHHVEVACLVELKFDEVLDILDRGNTLGIELFDDTGENGTVVGGAFAFERFFDGIFDLVRGELLGGSVPFENLFEHSGPFLEYFCQWGDAVMR